MAKFDATLNLSYGNKQYNYSTTFSATESVIKEQKVDYDAFITLLNLRPDDVSENSIKEYRYLIVHNPSPQTAEIRKTTRAWTDGTPDADSTNDAYESFFLRPNEYIVLPNPYFVDFSATSSATDAYAIDNKLGSAVNSGNFYVDSTADVDSATANGIVSSASSTDLYLEPYTSATNCTANLFRVGDIIRVRDEVMEVTAIGDKSDLANNKLTVKRGLYGSTAVTAAADDDPVRLAFFNTHSSYNKGPNSGTILQTNDSGNYAATNLLGYGRSVNSVTDGFVRGSIAIKFYNSGYQELGLSGITASTNSGLTASTTYYLTVAADGGSTQEISFTVDATNTNFGGANGVLNKIQTALDTQYITSSSNLFEKRVTVSLVDGDIRFTSASRNSASAIALTAGTSGAGASVRLLAQQNGRIPILASIDSAVASKLPEDTITVNNVSNHNENAFLYDDGYGTLSGPIGSGTIDYETGAITLTGCPANAEFAASFNYGAALAGGAESTASIKYNVINTIAAKSVNQHRDAVISLIACN